MGYKSRSSHTTLYRRGCEIDRANRRQSILHVFRLLISARSSALIAAKRPSAPRFSANPRASPIPPNTTPPNPPSGSAAPSKSSIPSTAKFSSSANSSSLATPKSRTSSSSPSTPYAPVSSALAPLSAICSSHPRLPRRTRPDHQLGK